METGRCEPSARISRRNDSNGAFLRTPARHERLQRALGFEFDGLHDWRTVRPSDHPSVSRRRVRPCPGECVVDAEAHQNARGTRLGQGHPGGKPNERQRVFPRRRGRRRRCRSPEEVTSWFRTVEPRVRPSFPPSAPRRSLPAPVARLGLRLGPAPLGAARAPAPAGRTGCSHSRPGPRRRGRTATGNVVAAAWFRLLPKCEAFCPAMGESRRRSMLSLRKRGFNGIA